jgi:hypothetical protein
VLEGCDEKCNKLPESNDRNEANTIICMKYSLVYFKVVHFCEECGESEV